MGLLWLKDGVLKPARGTVLPILVQPQSDTEQLQRAAEHKLRAFYKNLHDGPYILSTTAIENLFQPELNLHGSNRRAQENRTMSFWAVCLLDCKGQSICSCLILSTQIVNSSSVDVDCIYIQLIPILFTFRK